MNTSDFLQALYSRIPSGYAEIRLIAETGSKRPIQLFRPMPLGTVNQDALDKLHKHNESYHIYHRIGISLEPKDSKEQIIFLPALWVDVDHTDGKTIIEAMQCPPSLVVASGGGFHGYWLLRDPLPVNADNLALIEQTLDGIAVACGGDRACKNVNRILRTPGFKNIKAKYGENKPISSVVNTDGYLYRFDELKRIYSPLGQDLMAVGRGLPLASPNGSDSDLPGWVKHYLKWGATSGKRHVTLFGAAMDCNRCGLSESATFNLLAGRALADGLPANEVKQTIASVYRKAARVIVPNHLQGLMSLEDRNG